MVYFFQICSQTFESNFGKNLRNIFFNFEKKNQNFEKNRTQNFEKKKLKIFNKFEANNHDEIL